MTHTASFLIHMLPPRLCEKLRPLTCALLMPLSHSQHSLVSLSNCVPLCLSYVYSLALTSACAVRLASLSVYDTVCFKALGPERRSSSFPCHTELCRPIGLLNTKSIYLPDTAIKPIQSTTLGYKIIN